MIEIVGTGKSKEMDAAESLKELLCQAIHNLDSLHNTHALIIPSVQCYGENPRDVDLVLLLWDQRLEEKISRTSNGARVRSLCVTIEVKGHSSRDVWFRGEKCYVRYNGEDHDVSSQSERQKYSLLEFLRKNIGRKTKGRARTPFIDNLIWLVNVPNAEIPAGSNVLGRDSSWQEFLDLLELTQPKITPKNPPYVGFLDKNNFESTKAVLVDRIEPTRIDRKKMENISKEIMTSDQEYAAKIGQQLLILRGRGGTGKTVRLLRMAHQLYNEKQSRILILTYNRALVSDLTRLLALLNIKHSTADKSIEIRSIYSFLYEWLDVLGVLNKDNKDLFLKEYDNLKGLALEYLEEGAITQEEVQNTIAAHSRALAWDIVMIDESQDWPENERDILYKLYRPEKFILADGVDQLVRSTNLINWRERLPHDFETQVVPLTKSLRLKGELCRFVAKFADTIDYPDWNLKPVPSSHGGRVIIYTGHPFNHHIIQDALKTSEEDGNRNIDSLVCVPPSLAGPSGSDDPSLAARYFLENGYNVWDGVKKDVREAFAQDLDDIRIVQYDSCRGLEGWAVFNLCFDEFFDYKKAKPDIDDKNREDMFFDEDEARVDFAKRWLMIPLTRAIDTLVIHISDPESYIGTVLRELRDRYPEEIQWVEP